MAEKLEPAEQTEPSIVSDMLRFWTERISFSGDFGCCHDFVREEGQRERNGQRIRARLKMQAKASDEVDVISRYAGGLGSPASNNQTLENGFSGKNIRPR